MTVAHSKPDVELPSADVIRDLHRTDGPDPRLRDRGRPAHGGRRDAGLPAPLRRPGGGRRRRHERARRRRPDHLDPPRPRPRRRQGRRRSGRCSPSSSAGSTGYCHGRGGSMHINDLAHRHARRQRHRRRRASRSRSAPRSPTGTAARQAVSRDVLRRRRHATSARSTRPPTWPPCCKLPVVFVCENNGYAEFTPQRKHMLLTDVADRAASYGMPSEIVRRHGRARRARGRRSAPWSAPEPAADRR